MQNMMRQRGEQEVESLVESFREECAGLLVVGGRRCESMLFLYV